jgi:hypothetical protein
LDDLGNDGFDGDVSDSTAGVEVEVTVVVVDWPGSIAVEYVDVEEFRKVDETGNDACKGSPEQ